jgi:hypothetical protein
MTKKYTGGSIRAHNPKIPIKSSRRLKMVRNENGLMRGKRLNIVGLDTVWGFKTIELYEGDLSSKEVNFDLLIVSAFADGYKPLAGTLLGDLNLNLGFDIRDEEKTPAYDFRRPLGLWISRELQEYPFRRILALEMTGGYWPINECISNAFAAVAALSAKRIDVRTVAMPVLGAGHQKIPLSEIVPSLLAAAEASLRRHELPRRVIFVEKNPSRARHLAQEMDRTLRRAAVTLPHTEVLLNLRADLRRALDHAAELVADGYKGLFDEARRVFDSESTSSSEIGVIARSLAEFVVDDLLGRGCRLISSRKLMI